MGHVTPASKKLKMKFSEPIVSSAVLKPQEAMGWPVAGMMMVSLIAEVAKRRRM